MIDQNSDETILIIKPGALGDVLHMTPVVKAIREKRSDARICFLVGSEMTSEILEHNHFVDEIILFKKGRGVGEIKRIVGLANSLREKKPDLVLNYQPSNWRWSMLTFVLRTKRVIRYKKQKGLRQGERVLHAVEDHLRPLAALGIKSEPITYSYTLNREEITASCVICAPSLSRAGKKPDLSISTVVKKLVFFLSEKELEEGKRLLESQTGDKGKVRYKGLIGLNLGASHPVNRWPIKHFHELDTILQKRGYKAVLIGGKQDRALAEEFFALGASDALDLVGRASITQTAAVLSHCDLLVSADTGPLHLATAVGTRVVGLYGAADPLRTGPIGDGHIVIQAIIACVPCRKRRCKSGKTGCMEVIKPEVVADIIIRHIKRGNVPV